MVAAQRPSDMRRHNLALVLRAIRDHPGTSRAQVSDQLGLTRAALTGLVAELLSLDLIVEDGPGGNAIGRPRTQLRPNPLRFMAVGLDARLDRIKAVAIDLTGQPLQSTTHSIPDQVTPPGLARAIAETLDSLTVQVGRQRVGVGLALPSKAAPGLITQPAWGWQDEPFGRIVADALGFEVTIRDISEAACLANARQAELTSSQRVLHVQVGAGAGMALAIRGDLDPQSPPTWGQLGHVPLGDPNRACRCGRVGCLDASIGFDAFVDYCAGSSLVPERGPARLNRFAELVGLAAEHGDPIATSAIARVREHLARSLDLLTRLESPDAITLGGYPLFLGDQFFQQLEADLTRQLGAASPLRRSPLGDDASTIGAALTGLDIGLANPAGIGQ